MEKNRGQGNYGKKQEEKLKRQLKMKFVNSCEHLKNILLEEKCDEI